jgi:biopolymer transport protein ExbD
MAISVGGSKGGALAEMNVVPLIDILLVLLIIFMIITPLTPKGLAANIPQAKTDAAEVAPVPDVIVVQVLADHRSGNAVLKINNEVSTWESLGSRIDQIFRARAEKVAFVKGDNDVMFTDVARAIDVLRGAGVEKVGLLTAGLAVAR